MPTMTCPNYSSDHCMQHDYDHVLERREGGTGQAQARTWARQLDRVADGLRSARSSRTLASTVIVDRSAVHASASGGIVGEASTMFRGDRTPDAFMMLDRTGAPVLFTYVDADRDSEGDITGWRFASARGCRAIVIND